jgi:hypothetical protein
VRCGDVAGEGGGVATAGVAADRILVPRQVMEREKPEKTDKIDKDLATTSARVPGTNSEKYAVQGLYIVNTLGC